MSAMRHGADPGRHALRNAAAHAVEPQASRGYGRGDAGDHGGADMMVWSERLSEVAPRSIRPQPCLNPASGSISLPNQ